MDKKDELLKGCKNTAAILLNRLEEFINVNQRNSGGYVISCLIGRFEYKLNSLLKEMFPDEIQKEISDDNRLNRACHYLGYVFRRLDYNRDEAVFWIKSGNFKMDPHFVGDKDEYEIIGDLILKTMDESDRNERLMEEIVEYVNKRMASDNWRE